MIKVLFPGSFDPPTLGHLDIIKRISKMFDSVTILVSVHPDKESLFTAEQRVQLIKEMITGFSNVTVDFYDGLVVKYAKHKDINILVRGIRNSIDFNYETELMLANKFICKDVETVFINAKPDLVNIKSCLVNELFGYSVDISSLVTPGVLEAMNRRQ